MLGKSLTLAAVLAGLAGSQGTDVEQQVALLVRLDAQLARELKLVSQPLNAPVLSAHITTDASQDTLRITFSCVPGVYIVQTRLLISAPVRLDAGHCARTTGVTLFARGTLSGMLRTQGAVPDALYFDVKRCVGGRLGAVAVGRYVSVPDNLGRWAVDVPADCLDVAVSTPELAPMPLPRLAITLGQTMSVGEIAFERGTVLSVRVLTREGKPVADTEVALMTAEQYPTVVENIFTGQMPAPDSGSSRTDVHGRISLPGAAGLGVYVVAWRERTLGIVGPLLLDREVPRQDVTVELEGEVAVGISIGGSPAWRSDQRLMLKATPRVGLRWIPAASVTAPLTLNTSSRIMLPAPGLWRIEVRAGDGDNSTVVAQRTVTIDAHRPNLLEFDLAARQYRGQVNAGTGEVNGTLSFTPEAPLVELARARVANGRFTVVLPTPGAYLGAFTSDDGSFVRSQVRVEVVDTEHAVVVALPTGTLAGTVVLPTGGAAPRATVTLKSRGAASAANASGSRQTTTDPSGGFSFQGLLDGTYELEASLQRSRAVPVVVTVQTAGMPQTVAPIPLREGGFFVRGRVTTANGEPLPGAAGTVVLESIDIGATPAVSTFTTDLLGYFRAALDRPARGWMHVTVATPGRAVTVFRIPAPPDNAPLLLQVSQFGGQCRLSLPAPTSTGRDLVVEADSYVLVNAAGARTSLAQLIDMRAALVIPGEHETTVVIPLLAVDTWKLESASAINAGQTFREEDPARPGTVRHFTLQPNTITKVTAR